MFCRSVCIFVRFVYIFWLFFFLPLPLNFFYYLKTHSALSLPPSSSLCLAWSSPQNFSACDFRFRSLAFCISYLPLPSRRRAVEKERKRKSFVLPRYWIETSFSHSFWLGFIALTIFRFIYVCISRSFNSAIHFFHYLIFLLWLTGFFFFFFRKPFVFIFASRE